jgi:hypothetical protein
MSGNRDTAERVEQRKEHGAWVRLLGPGEAITGTYRLPRTALIFTTRRLILVDEGLTGRQVEYLSLPYRAISAFSVESSGQFSPEADLKIWIAGRTGPVERSFSAGVDVYEVQGLLAQYLSGSGV